jgi:hypothetical protein
VGLKAELRYADGTERSWQTGGWYSASKGRITFRYKLRSAGLIAQLPGNQGEDKVRIQGEITVNADATRLECSSSGAGFSGRDVATRERPFAPEARLSGTYLVRSNWSSMTQWSLRFHMRQFQGGSTHTDDIDGEKPTRCVWINRDTISASVWISGDDTTLVQQVVVLRVVDDPSGQARDLQPISCYTVTIDSTAADPAAATQVTVQPQGATTVEQPDGRVRD